MANKAILAVTVALSCIVTTCFAEDTLMRVLMTRVEALEKQGAQQAEQVKQQADEIQTLRSLVKDLNVKMTNNELPQQDEAIVYSVLDKPNGGRPADVNAGPVAFHTLLEVYNITNLQGNQTIVFPAVQTNIGNGFNPNDGVFTAPVPGIYIFSLTIEAMPYVYVEVSIKKNGMPLAYSFASGYRGDEVYDQGSVTVVTQLAVGDQIWPSLYNPQGSALFGAGFSSFMGCLINAL